VELVAFRRHEVVSQQREDLRRERNENQSENLRRETRVNLRREDREVDRREGLEDFQRIDRELSRRDIREPLEERVLLATQVKTKGWLSYGKRELLMTGQILLLAALYKKSTSSGKGLG